MVGLIGIRRDTVFRPLGPLAEAKVKEEAPLPDDKAQFVMVLYVDPAYARRGLMKVSSAAENGVEIAASDGLGLVLQSNLLYYRPCVDPALCSSTGSAVCRQLDFRSHRPGRRVPHSRRMASSPLLPRPAVELLLPHQHLLLRAPPLPRLPTRGYLLRLGRHEARRQTAGCLRVAGFWSVWARKEHDE
jgi:hypothetical protein